MGGIVTFATDIQTDIGTIITEAGSSVSFTTHTFTKDSMGRITSDSTSAGSVAVRIEAITAKDEKLLNLGWAQVGDLKIFSATGVLSLHQTFPFNSRTYELVKQIGDRNMAGTDVFDVFIAKLYQA